VGVLGSLHNIALYTIASYCKRVGRGVGRFRLMELLFLADYLSLKRLGRKLTGIEWRKHLFGPSSTKVFEVLDGLEREGMVAVEEISRGILLYKAYRAIEEPSISKEAENIVNEVIEKFGSLDIDELLNHINSLDEVKSREPGEKIL
jgi:uncharacterized phage-associated protein